MRCPSRSGGCTVGDGVARRMMVRYASEWDFVGLGAEILLIGWNNGGLH